MSSRFQIKPWVLLIIICLLLSIIWFHTGFIEGGGEEGLAFYDPLRTYTLSKVMWWEYDAGFPTLAWVAQTKTFFITSFLFNKLHFPNFILQAGVFGMLLLTGSLSVYHLTREVLGKNLKNTIIPFVTAIFYLFNPYSMTQIWGRGLEAQFFAFGLLPLSVYLFFCGLKKKKFFYLLLLSLSSAILSSAYGLTTFIIVYWSVLTVVFLYWVIANKIKSKKELVFYVVYYFAAIILWGVCNIDWLLPTVFEGNKIYSAQLSNPQENLGILIGVSQNYTPLVLIRLLQDTYFASPYALSPLYFTFIFRSISYLYPVFLFIGIWAILRKKEFHAMRVFLVIFLVGIIVSLGANPPFGDIFIWVFERFPFLQGFRNPYEKYGIVYAFAYAPLFAIGVYYFVTSQFKNKHIRTIGLFTILVILCGIFVWPMYTGRVIAGVDRKLGIEVPIEYRQVNNWLKDDNKNDARILLTPIWPGDGAFYEWKNGTQYNGLDPTMYLLDYPTISNIPSNFPFYTDFLRNIRENIYKYDVSGALSLLRIQYIISRNDPMFVSKAEENHYSYLTSAIYPPNPTDSLSQLICENQKIVSDGVTPATIGCEIDKRVSDWSNYNYLQVVIKVDEPAYIDLAVRDNKLNNPRWYGREGKTYLLPKDTWTTLILPLGAPTEVSYKTDFSSIEHVQIYAHPIGKPTASVKNLEIQGVWLDSGEKKEIDNFNFVKKFGALDLYKATDPNIVPEFGLLSSVETVESFDELVLKSFEKRNEVNTHGFILSSQNNKNYPDHKRVSTRQIAESDYISETAYWAKLKNKGSGLIILSKKYNSEWKLITGVEKKDLQGGLLNNINLLKKSFLGEDKHFVVNGYANLWVVDGDTDTVAVVFLPQVYADIGTKISLIAVITILVTLLLFIIKRKFYAKR